MARQRKQRHTGAASAKHGRSAGAPEVRRTPLPDIVLMITIPIIVMVVFGGATKNGLLNWDDNVYITESTYLKDLSWPGMKAIFTAYVAGNYHPLTLLSFALEYAFAGKVDPALMHGTNVVLHSLNTLLVFMLGRRLLGSAGAGAITALLFGLHPMHVESVAWISERKDVLYTFFFLLSLLCYLRYTARWEVRWYAGALFLFALSLFSKSAAAALAPLLFIIDLWVGRAWSWRSISEKLPFFALAIGFGIVALWSQEGAMQETFAPHFPIWQRPVIVLYALSFYLVRFIIPHSLSAIHPYPIEPGESLVPLLGPAMGTVLIAGSLLYLTYRHRTYWRVAVFGSLFFVTTLAMVLQFIPVGRAIVAERYTYVPYIGLSLIVALLVTEVWRSGKNRSSVVHYIPAALLTVALIGFTTITRMRIAVWKNSYTLFADMLARYPTDGLIHYNRGLTNFYDRNFKESIKDYDACILYKPDCVPCYFNRGLSFKELGDMSAVVRDMDKALLLEPDYVEAFQNRGNAKAMLKDYEGSIADLTRALQYTPSDTNLLMNRGLSYHFNEQRDRACADWRSGVDAGSRKCLALVKDQCGVHP